MDAWGHELVFVPADTKMPGADPQPTPYLMSPGLDGEIETIENNIYGFVR